MESRSNFLTSQIQKLDEPLSLQSLQEDILLGILSHVANNSLKDIRSVEFVSKKLFEMENKNFVLKNLPLHQVDLFSEYQRQYGKRYYKFMKRCRQNENLEAIYRKGLINFFHRTSGVQHHNKGLLQMAKATKDGNEEATYIYGLTLLCIGGENVDEGLHTLSSLMKGVSTISSLRSKLKALQYKNMHGLWWWDTKIRKTLKSKYIKKVCNCDGRPPRPKVVVWDFNASDYDIPISDVCPICFWDSEVRKVCEFL